MTIKSISIIFRRKKKESDIAEIRGQNKEIVPEASTSKSSSTMSNINTQSDSDLHLMRGDSTLKCMFENIASQKSK